jgi:hypothetical protein
VKRDLELMEHADGETRLSDSVLRPEDRAKLDALGELGELVRGRLELAADDVPDKRLAAMWREIDKGIEANLVEHASDPARGKASGGGPWRRLTRFFDQYRGHLITGVVSAGAVAALAIWLRPSGSAGTASTSHAPIDVRAVVHRPAEIEELDTPGGTGMVFNLDDEDGSTTVIWVTPEDTVDGI